MSPFLLQVAVFSAAALFAGAASWLLLKFTASKEIGPAARLSLRPTEANSPTSKFDVKIQRLAADMGIGLHPNVVMLALCGFSILIGLGVFVFCEDLPLAILGMGGSFSLLFLGLIIWQRRRQAQVIEQLPNAIEMLARGVQAGESFEQAFRSVSENTGAPLAAELRRAVQKLDLGQAVPDTLRQLEQRYPFFDMQMFVSAITIHRQAGGDLPATLERLSLVSRERMAYRRRLKSMLASARLAALLIALATPCLLLYYSLNKDYLGNLLLDANGQFYLLLAIGLEVCGVAWLFALSRSEI